MNNFRTTVFFAIIGASLYWIAQSLNISILKGLAGAVIIFAVMKVVQGLVDLSAQTPREQEESFSDLPGLFLELLAQSIIGLTMLIVLQTIGLTFMPIALTVVYLFVPAIFAWENQQLTTGLAKS